MFKENYVFEPKAVCSIGYIQHTLSITLSVYSACQVCKIVTLLLLPQTTNQLKQVLHTFLKYKIQTGAEGQKT